MAAKVIDNKQTGFFYICQMQSRQKKILVLSGISGSVCVALGALGAHALKEKLPAENLQWFETGVKYQFFHTLAILFVSLLAEKIQSSLLNYAPVFFIGGILLFSFSLYFLALRPLLGIGNEEMKWIGAVTPLGGLSFIMAWLMLTFGALKHKNS